VSNIRIRKCEYRVPACPWHKKCHCKYGISRGGIYRGTENMPFCYKLVKADKCPRRGKEKRRPQKPCGV